MNKRIFKFEGYFEGTDVSAGILRNTFEDAIRDRSSHVGKVFGVQVYADDKTIPEDFYVTATSLQGTAAFMKDDPIKGVELCVVDKIITIPENTFVRKISPDVSVTSHKGCIVRDAKIDDVYIVGGSVGTELVLIRLMKDESEFVMRKL